MLYLGWCLTPTRQAVYYFLIWHLIGLGIVLILQDKMMDLLQSEYKGHLSLGIVLSSYNATMAGQILGNLIFITLGPSMLGIPSTVLTSIFVGLF